MSDETLAAADIGTNSIHLVIARAAEGHRFDVLAREKEMVRLGSAGGDMKELRPDAVDRGVEALTRFRRLSESFGAPLTAVATSAIREAENASDFLDRARDEAGVDVAVISGMEEARLIHLGVLQALPIFDRQHLVVDIGGGSTEIVLAQRDSALLSRSLKLGAVRLTRRFFADDDADDESIDACRRHIRSVLATVAHDARSLTFEVAAGSSGTIESVASMVHATRDDGPAPRTLNGFEFKRKEVRRVVKLLAAADSVSDRRQLEGLDPSRADIILAGALILYEVMRSLEIDSMVVSENALREGVLLDALERQRGSARHHLHDVRRRSVVHLMELCDEDVEHAEYTARLALQLFDATREWHEFDDSDRELLEAAALLANVGLFVSHAQHHKHTYYVIRNSEHLAGFTDREIEVIAQVARYHRKSEPRSKHAEYAALSKSDQRRVAGLAGMLRVAISLDRTHDQLVTGIACKGGSKKLTLELTARPATDVSLELYTATERKALLEKTFDRSIDFAVIPAE